MNPLVIHQLFVFGEGLATMIANIRALVSMKLVVHIQIAFTAKPPTTLRAAEGFLSRYMNDPMSSQQNKRVKFPSTVFTAERFAFLPTSQLNTSAF